MPNIAELRAKHTALVGSAGEIRAKITDKTTADERTALNTEFDAKLAEADGLLVEIHREERLAEAQRHLDSPRDQRRGGREDETAGGDQPEAGKLTYRAAVQAYMRVGFADLTPEARALLRGHQDRDPDLLRAVEREQRAQGIATSAAGGYTVAPEFQTELTRTMKAYGPMFDGGLVREVNTGTGATFYWPTADDTANSATAASENAAHTSEGDVVFGQLSVTAYKRGSGAILISNELLQDSALPIDTLVAELMGERIGRDANALLTTGTGSGQPQGIVTGSTMGKTAASATALTGDELIDFYHSIDPAYRGSPAFRFMFNDSTLRTLRKLKDGQGNYLIENLRDGSATINLGGISVPYVINQAVASIATGTKPIVAGDFRKYLLRRVRESTIVRLNERYADADQVGFLGWTRFDGKVLDTSAIKHFVMA